MPSKTQEGKKKRCEWEKKNKTLEAEERKTFSSLSCDARGTAAGAVTSANDLTLIFQSTTHKNISNNKWTAILCVSNKKRISDRKR
jgi:hypothetical protein